MIDQEGEERRERGTFLSILLAGWFACLAAVALFATCGAFSLVILAVVGGFTAVGCLHYLFWGHSLSQQVGQNLAEDNEAGERSEFEILDLDNRPFNGPY